MATKREIDARAADRHKPRHGVYLTPDLWEALAKMARDVDRPVSWMVRRILTEAVKSRKQ